MSVSTQKSDFIHLYVPSRNIEWPPTLLLLHGTGGDENDLLPLSHILAPEANVLSVRGQIVENGRTRFFRRISEGVFDLEDLKFRARELAKFVEKSSTTYGFDLKKLIAIGYSNGANIAAALLFLFPRLFAAAVLFRPMVPLIPEPLPDLSGVAVFISSGTKDSLTPREQPENLAKMLRDCGAVVNLNWEDSDHGITVEEVNAAREWLSSRPFFSNPEAKS